MSLLSKFVKRSALDPLQRMVNDATASLENKLTNAVDDAFSGLLKKTGLSSSIVDKLSAQFSDSIKNELSDAYFQVATSAQARLSKKDIKNSIAPKFAETSTDSVQRLSNDNNPQVMQYPQQIGKYFIKLHFREYTRTAPQAKLNLGDGDTIVLPVPSRLEENFNINVNQRPLGIYGAGADLLNAYSSKGGGEFHLEDSIGALAYSFAAMIAESNIGESSVAAAGQFIGAIPNPHMATIFSGVDMREHSFEWKFAPRNKEESAKLKEIVNSLRKNSLPTFSTTGTAALQYPHLCIIDLYPWAASDDPLMKFKPALLKSVSVNYSPNGIPSFFAGTNLPTFVSISLRFVETEYFTGEDFGAVPGSDKVQMGVDIAKEGLGLAQSFVKGIVGDSTTATIGANEAKAADTATTSAAIKSSTNAPAPTIDTAKKGATITLSSLLNAGYQATWSKSTGSSGSKTVTWVQKYAGSKYQTKVTQTGKADPGWTPVKTPEEALAVIKANNLELKN
jgi:hypothetical protein